jgi:hypothetical protein
MPLVQLAPDARDFYASQSDFSTPGTLTPLYAGLPSDPAELARIARGLIIHRLEGDLLGYAAPRDRLHNDAETRYVDDILRIIVDRDGAPLTRPRAFDDRFVGICRDFSLLFCSFLRHTGVPARTRSGFADYFGDDAFRVDHMVTEYWDERRGWVLADAQLAGPRIVEAFGVDFDPMDVPRDRFLVAGAALREIREGRADPRLFGIPLPDGRLLAGEWFVIGNVRLDLAALNKVETLLWDVWGAGAAGDDDLTDEIRELYDGVAAVTSGEVPFGTARALFTENDDLRTPGTVLSLAPFTGPSEVTLRGGVAK